MMTKRIKEENPLSGVQCDINLIFCAPDAPMETGLVTLETDQIKEAIIAAFKQKFVNFGEVFPLALCDGKLVLKIKITRIEGFKQGMS